ncbi:hypothetical protein N8T08_004883 [Aspergillus melleus]|uniref:Uncharacterized protein n=1 Tax=Aspergillus melleus TaxID=138277 RepID=A0ACC3B3V3_9EURO|nr:hypothetical protein N8T08_004883 [Aspergillus melleus]
MPPNPGSVIGDVNNDDYVAQVLAGEARDSSLKYSSQGMGAYMPKRCEPKQLPLRTTPPNPTIAILEPTVETHDVKGMTTVMKDTGRIDAGIEVVQHPRTGSVPVNIAIDMIRKKTAIDHPAGVVDIGPTLDREVAHLGKTGIHTLAVTIDAIDAVPIHPHGRGRGRDLRDERSGRHRSREREPSRKHTTARKESSTAPSQQNGHDTDPLEDLVGPLPPKANGFDENVPIRSRGRGAYRPNASNIDAHFAADYDPTLDVQLEDDDSTAKKSTRRPVPGLMTGDDDWELALEAVRDRARWRQRGEERLREAGFNDSFVERWKSNTTPTAAADDSEGRLEDVKWSKKGEGREWDRGKFVDDEGHIDVKAAW